MANYPRKILYAEPENPPGSDKGFSSDCYMCYACPDHCYIPPPPSQFVSESDPQKGHVSTILIFMLCILGLAFLLLSYLYMVRNRLRNSRRRTSVEFRQNSMADFLDENQGPVLDHHIWYIRTVGLPQSVIDSIGSFLYKNGDGLIECKDCSICLSEFQENETLRLLPKCSHAFHGGCIDVWLRSHKNCPVCRAPVVLVATTVTRPSLDESNFTPISTEVPSQGEVEVEEPREVMPARFDSRNKRGRVLSDIVDHRVKVDSKELRRSVSMDFSIFYETTTETGGKGCSEVEKQNSDMVVKRDCKNSSIYRLIKSTSLQLQRGPVSMKRSFSLSGKRSMRKKSRSQELINAILD